MSDRANGASLAVMLRLGMLRYPLGKGFQYALARGDPGPKPQPALIAMG